MLAAPQSLEYIDSPESSKSRSRGIGPMYLVGFTVAGLVLMLVGVYVVWRIYRKGPAAKRDAGFLSVQGLVKDVEKDAGQNPPPPYTPGFSSLQATPPVAFPEKTLIIPPPPSASKNDVIRYHHDTGTYPQPFAFAISANISTSPTLHPGDNTSVRRSFLSATENRSSMGSYTSSTTSSQTERHVRKVRQLYTPVLPDELLLCTLGEKLNVIQSFDDGWCVVGRAGPAFNPNHRSLFGRSPKPEGEDVELGVVPAWCFLKPVKGVAAERPMRSSSLGVTVQVAAPGGREETISWSNFG